MNSIVRFCVPMVLALTGTVAHAGDFGLPVDCKAAGVECRVQQYVDMATGPTERDPFCGSATYDGHDGTDIRVLSMRDVDKGVSVVAMADGKVLRLRDGEPDRLVQTTADRVAIANKECGNGLVVSHGDYEVQYCHLRQGSIGVTSGMQVKAGDKLGEVGASGLAQFPHVHVTFRKSGAVYEPVTGNQPDMEGTACTVSADGKAGLWTDDAAQDMIAMAIPLLASGVSGAVTDHGTLSENGPPVDAKSTDGATVGWAWFANLKKGDQIELMLKAPDGSVFSQNLTDPMDRNKADYFAYVGRKRPPAPGDWSLDVSLIRDGTPIFQKSTVTTVK